MRKLALIGILSVGISYGNSVSQMIKANCGNVRPSQCIDFFKKQCDVGKMIHCGFVGDMLHALDNIYESRRYYKMACDRIDLNASVDIFKTADGRTFNIDLQDRKNIKGKFCYNFVVVSKDLYLKNPKNLTKQDEQDFINALKTACDLGYSGACVAIDKAKQIARQRRRYK